MQIQLITCQVGVRQEPEDENFKLVVTKIGATAIRVSEVPIIHEMNGMDSVFNISPVKGEDGKPVFIEVTKAEEHARLMRRYKKSVVQKVYPTASIPMPKSIDDLDLERSMVAVEKDEAYELRQQLKAMGQNPHPATGVDKLRALLDQVNQDAA